MLDDDTDTLERPEPGKEYGMTYASDPRAYYYWRRNPGP
jgi:hypothetical protein